MVAGAAPRFTHCTISGNRGVEAGGVHCFGDAVPLLKSSIVWGNAPNTSCGARSHCLTRPSDDPLFVSAGAFDFTRFKTATIAGEEVTLPDFVVEEPDFRLRPRHFRARRLERRPVLAIVDGEQQVALADGPPFAEVPAPQVPLHPGTDLDRVHGRHPAGVVVPLGHRALDDLCDVDVRWRKLTRLAPSPAAGHPDCDCDEKDAERLPAGRGVWETGHV